jgi:hypothetical protein
MHYRHNSPPVEAQQCPCPPKSAASPPHLLLAQEHCLACQRQLRTSHLAAARPGAVSTPDGCHKLVAAQDRSVAGAAAGLAAAGLVAAGWVAAGLTGGGGGSCVPAAAGRKAVASDGGDPPFVVGLAPTLAAVEPGQGMSGIRCERATQDAQTAQNSMSPTLGDTNTDWRLAWACSSGTQSLGTPHHHSTEDFVSTPSSIQHQPRKKTTRSESRSWHPKSLCSTSMKAPPHVAVFFKQEQLLSTSVGKQDGLFSFRKQRTSDYKHNRQKNAYSVNSRVSKRRIFKDTHTTNKRTVWSCESYSNTNQASRRITRE